MKLHETKLDDSPRKPFSEMDESELRATAGALDHRIHELANLFGDGAGCGVLSHGMSAYPDIYSNHQTGIVPLEIGLEAQMTKLNQAIATLRVAEAKASAYARGSNEGGEGYNPHQAEVDAALDAVVAADNEAFAAEWTAEVFAARRTQWNAEVGKYKGQAVDAALIAKIEAATGIKIADMRRAKELHG